MRLKLTTKSVKDLKPQSKIYKVWDTEIKGFFLRVMPTGTKTYCLHYRHKSKGRDYTIGKSGNVTCSLARDIAKDKTGQIARGVDIQEEKKLERRIVEASKYQTLGGFLENKYSPWVLVQRKTGSASLQRIKYNFPHLMARDMSEIKAWDIQKWRTEALKSGKRPSSLNRDLVALKSCLSKAVEWEILTKSPLAGMKPLRLDDKGKIRFMAQDEESRFRKALNKREHAIKSERLSANQWRLVRGYELLDDLSDKPFADYLKPMVLLAINTGMRRGELFDLNWSSVNLNRAWVTIEGKTSKSGKTRHIPLNSEALGTLIAWRNQTKSTELVFPNPNTGKRFDNIATSWQGLLKLAEIDNLRFHDLRHHFASKLVMAGVDLNTVRELLGHADLTMTLRYAHLAPEHKAAAVALLNE